MNATYLKIELTRVMRDVSTVFFVGVLPALLYLIFGAAQEYGALTLAGGNVTMFVMISMAAYGAVTATTGVGGMAAVERMQGWGRQLGLTPMSDAGFVATKTLVGFVVSIIPVALIYGLGVLTGAEATTTAWVVSGVAVLIGSALFSLYGLMVGLMFRTEAAIGAASGVLVLFAFLGNVFTPLSGALLTFAKFTPLYGYVFLVCYPVTEGLLIQMDGPPTTSEALWVPILNLLVWSAIFGVLATLLVRRGRGRQ